MDLEVGMRVARAVGEFGFVAATEKRRCWMVEVRWDSSGIKQWIPADQVRYSPVVEAPPVRKLPWRGKTAPAYLGKLRKTLRGVTTKNSVPPQEKEKATKKLTGELAALSGKKKNRSRHKARRKIVVFEARYLSERIARDDRHDSEWGR
jgi:hypothetical protein